MRGARIITVLLAGMIAACAPARDFDEAQQGRAALTALTPTSLGRNLTLSQRVTGELAAEGASLRFELEVREDKLVLVGLTPTGVSLFTVTQQGKTWDSRSRFPNGTPEGAVLDPAYMLADIKLTYWPVEALNLALGAKRWRVLEEVSGEARRRVLIDPLGQTIAEVIYPPRLAAGDIVLKRYDIPYRLKIRTLNMMEGTV